MKSVKKISIMFLLLFVGVCQFSCKKYLDEKPNKKLGTLATVEDCEAFLDETNLNRKFPFEIEIGTDNFYYTADLYDAIFGSGTNLFIWGRFDLNPGTYLSLYDIIKKANLVIETMANIKVDALGQKKYDNTLGNAYFWRGYIYFILSQLYAQPYEGSSANEANLGLQLRLSTDPTKVIQRSNVSATYKQIQQDLQQAALLLDNSAKFKTRSCKPAAYAALSKVYLAIKDYENAGLYAKKSLDINDTLLDFNNLSSLNNSRFNSEILFHMEGATFEAYFQLGIANVDEELFGQYHQDDLRKQVFFMDFGLGMRYFKGGYEGNINGMVGLFGGIATDEMYLIYAESLARASKLDDAMLYLEKLLIKRYKTGTYSTYHPATKEDAVKFVLQERRKELLFRGTRWTDLRRLKDEASYAVIPKRVIGNKTYELLPDNPRYTLLIPADAINSAGLQQNP